METPKEKLIKNPILRLLNGLPAQVSENKKAILREYNRGNYYRHWINADYDIKKISVEDMIKLKQVLEVSDDFFVGDESKVEESLKNELKKHQSLITA